jgi:hypothetical protein
MKLANVYEIIINHTIFYRSDSQLWRKGTTIEIIEYRRAGELLHVANIRKLHKTMEEYIDMTFSCDILYLRDIDGEQS